MPGSRAAVLCALLALACASSSRADGVVDQLATPLFAFSNQDSVFVKTSSLEVQADLQSVLRELITGVLQPAEQATRSALLNAQQAVESRPDVVLTVLGSQLTSSDLKRQADSLLRPLQDMMSSAASSLSLPYVMQQFETLQSDLEASMSDMLASAGASHYRVIGCGQGAEGGAASAVEFLQQGDSSEGPVVVLVCSGAEQREQQVEQGLAAELGVLQQLQEAVQASGKKHVTLYAQQPTKEQGQYIQQRRRLMAAAGASNMYTTCDATCQMQVKFLQGILVAILMAFSVACGLACLNFLDTPTRFEKPKDNRND